MILGVYQVGNVMQLEQRVVEFEALNIFPHQCVWLTRLSAPLLNSAYKNLNQNHKADNVCKPLSQESIEFLEHGLLFLVELANPSDAIVDEVTSSLNLFDFLVNSVGEANAL